MAEYELVNPSDANENVQAIEWKTPEDFRGRFIRVDSIGQDGRIEVGKAIPVPDSEIVCDLCNCDIKDFPCPVVGSYALCGPSTEDCRGKRYHIEPGDTEYFETLAFSAEIEPPKPMVNFGGRKR